MGSGPDCDGQFIFAEDLLGSHSGHYPRHSITYKHLMQDAVEGLTRYREDVHSGAYPTAKHSIKIKDEEFEGFMTAIDDQPQQVSSESVRFLSQSRSRPQ